MPSVLHCPSAVSVHCSAWERAVSPPTVTELQAMETVASCADRILRRLSPFGMGKSRILHQLLPRLPTGRSHDCGINSNVNVCEKAKHHTELFWYKLYKFIFVTALARHSPQTYLQRPSSWGRATAGRQDVVSHVHTAMRKVYSLHSSSRQM